jgi:hypothetical protein
MTIRIIYGHADPLELETLDRWERDGTVNAVRTYRDDVGNAYVGTDTVDVDYYCDRDCAEQDLPWLTTDSTYVFHGKETADVEHVFGDWPDYSVHCARQTCADLLHVGLEDDEEAQS